MRAVSGAGVSNWVTTLPDVTPYTVQQITGSAGTAVARFTSCTVGVTNGADSSGAPVTLTFVVADAPTGYTVNVTVEIDGSVEVRTAIGGGYTLTTGRLTSSGTFIVLYTVRGKVTMQDRSGNVVAMRAIPPTIYYGV